MPNPKVLKDSRAGEKSASGPLKSPTKMQRPTLATSSSALAVPYRGTSKSNPNSTSPITPVADTPKAPPKKGSFAEIMARAKSAQMAAPAIGIIKHKPKETLSNKKEILLHKQGRMNKTRPESKDPLRRGILPNGGQGPDSGSSTIKTKPEIGGVNKKSAPQPTYKGTASAKPQPSYKGTMKKASSPVPPGRKNSTAQSGLSRSRTASIVHRSALNDRYLSEDEEEYDGEDDEDGDDLGGESSDDMEVGFSDVEEEEETAAKVARKEDEEQAKLELQMKRQKEERKKRLQLIAKSPKKSSF